MMDASMRKYSSFAWNFNKQNKGSARKFHMWTIILPQTVSTLTSQATCWMLLGSVDRLVQHPPTTVDVGSV